MRHSRLSVSLFRALVVLIASSALLIAGCDRVDDGAQDAGADAASLPWEEGAISPAALHERLAHKDFLLINVHVPHAGEIAGTDAHIPFTQIDAIVDFIGSDLDQRVVLYCLTNNMTDITEPLLVDRGYTGIRSLAGGMSAWEQAGYTIEP